MASELHDLRQKMYGMQREKKDIEERLYKFELNQRN